MVTESEILSDIQHMYGKIDQCYRSKQDLNDHISREKLGIIELEALMGADEIRVSAGKRPRYDANAMTENIARLRANIALFHETIKKEDANIASFHNMIQVLREDLARPKELIIDASQGQ